MTGSLAGVLGLNQPQTVAIVGSGGKTTLLYALGRQLAEQGEDVLVSTTTRILPPKAGEAEGLVCLEGRAPNQEQLARKQAGGRLLCLADRLGPDGKLVGISLEQVGDLAREGRWLLVEADGAACRPLKAWSGHEPVVPTQTRTLLVLAGMKGLGRPLGEDLVHRALAFSRVSGLANGDIITPEALAKVLLGPEGPLKALPPGARALLVLNQSETVSPRQLRKLHNALSTLAAGLPPGSPWYDKVFSGRLARGILREE